MKQVAAVPAPAFAPRSSKNGSFFLILILAIAAGGYWVYTQKKSAQATDSQIVAVVADEPIEVEAEIIVAVEETEKTLEKTLVAETSSEKVLVEEPVAKKTTVEPSAPVEKIVAEKPEPVQKAVVKKAPVETKVQALNQRFPVKTEFDNIDIRDYQKTYPEVFQGWMPNAEEQADDALRWADQLGPLGVRIRPHTPQLQGRPAFAANVPLAIQDTSGGLGLTAAEVVKIAPDSPAENHLQVGDLIIGIEGEQLKSGNQYRPDWKFMHKDARGLQLMFGEKIDQAQARGDIRLTVLRIPPSKSEALPIVKKEIWSGEGGNQSVGLQSFNIEIPSDGFITLETNQFDDKIHGDGAVWLDVIVEGDYGSQRLLSLPPESARAGYGRPQFTNEEPFTHDRRKYDESLMLHAQGEAKWLLPKGTKRIKGKFAAMSYGQVQPKIYHTNGAIPLTGVHKDHIVQLHFPIGKTGSFSDTYPKNCPKTELTVTRHTAWLAAQQRDDGSWPRLAGYTSDGWDTAWCGLALMSSGDPQYDGQVKKAAYRIAYETVPSEWTAERAMRLMFLSEYYLRTKDEGIVAGIQAAYFQVMDCCKTDYMAGHKVNGFGYGIAGQHYGTGHLALSVALASRTPITTNKMLVENIIRHAGEVSVNGTYGYGRGRRMARDDSRAHSGGQAMSGSGLLGVQIGGGHASAIKEYIERMDASIGDGDNSHATSSLAFIFSSLAIAAADENIFLKHMQNFRYKMTIDDNWEGGFLKSSFSLDLASGEGVTSSWIRSAGYILVLNALKQNLAITGKREFWNPNNIPTIAVSEWGGQVHSYYLRNWCLVKELLGNRAPQELSQGIQALHALPRTMELVPKTREIVLQRAPGLIQKIKNDRALSETQQAYAIELICGLDIKIYAEKEGSNQKIDVHINQPLHQLNWLDEDKAVMFDKSPFSLSTTVEIAADNLAERVSFETKDLEGFDLDQGTRKLSVTKPLKDAAQAEFDGTADISFKIGSTSVSYQRPLKFNTEFSFSNNYNLRRLKLKLKMAPRAYYQSQPLMIAGLPFDCMYPAERMLEIQGPADGSDVKIHEGDEVIVDLASENFICAWVHSLEFEKATQVTIFEPQRHKSISGSINGDLENLYDFDHETSCELIGENSKSIIQYDFGKEVTLNGLDAHYNGFHFIRVWYQNRGKWIPLVWDNYSVSTSHHPVFPDTQARSWRLEIHHSGNMEMQTLRFYHNPHRILPQAKLPQMDAAQFVPDIKPQ